MAAHEGPQLPVSGVPSAPPKVDEVQEYEKILRISDEIFSGTHPRLKVPQQFVRKVTPRTLQTPPVTNSQVTTAEPSGTSQSKEQQPTPSTTRPANAVSSLSGLPSTSATAAPSRITMKPTSEIDPIFLTKSDDLVRAEIQLQRQRVERVLRDQLDQKRLEARQKASAQEAKPDFDVSDVLTKALEIVKPVPPPSDIHGANGTAAPSDSFDENSFYSSRAPDSPQHGDQQPSPISERQVHPVDMEDMAADAPVDSRSDELQRFEPANPSGMDMERQAYTVADKRLHPQKQSQNGPAEAAADKYHQTREPVDAFEEPEYSPPGPDIPPERRDSREYNRRETFNQKRPAANGRPVDRGHNGRRSLSPANDVRVVRNHITSPAAPQPSRVSPLATAKVPSIQQQHRDSRQGYHVERVPTGHDSARTSPEAPVQQLMPRKRRRVQEPRDRPRQVLARRPAVDSPEPYIKEEPVSPPPFADVPPQERPVYIDIASPRYTPVVDRREPPIREPAYEVDRYGRAYEPDGHVEPGIARTVSRLGSRRLMRDDRDLRRVASLQHARQPEYAREVVEPAASVNPRSVRASSYAVVERPTQARYYDEPVPTYSRRYVPADEPPPSPRFREAYLDEEPPPRMMAPPRRRIVVDEHGNQYYETLPPPKVQEMPPPPSRVTKVDPYAERAPLRTASVRAPSIVEDPYGDRRYVQEMAPPQATYRRVTDYPGTTLERRPYARELDEREPVMRSGSVQVVDYPRHTTYIDERDLPRERLVRMSSVRPPPVARYEDPREGIHRVQSVRPGGREVSVYVDDEPRKPREYVERPVYAPARPVREERYYEDDDAGRMVLDGTRDVVHRMPQRY